MTEICSIIHKCTIHGEKNYMNLDFSSVLLKPPQEYVMSKSLCLRVASRPKE